MSNKDDIELVKEMVSNSIDTLMKASGRDRKKFLTLLGMMTSSMMIGLLSSIETRYREDASQALLKDIFNTLKKVDADVASNASNGLRVTLP